MFDHVTLRAADLAASQAFYRTTLSALGIEPTRADARRPQWDDFCLAPSDGEHPPTRKLHLGFVAPSRERVEAFWSARLTIGAPSDGEPGERPYTSGYYGAFLLDPDGNSAEALIHDDVRRGGHLDHLWIGVSDLEQASRFYATLARHLGLRPGRSWDAGRQFRGAWATFSLVADGRPPSEHVQLAFPAPDERTVEDFYESATAAGYRPGGAPAERPQELARGDPGCYSAYVLDPDGNNVESVYRGGRRAKARPGGAQAGRP